MTKHGDLQVAIIRKMKLFSPPRARDRARPTVALEAEAFTRGRASARARSLNAFMLAVGMVQDHVTSCFRWAELSS